MKRLLCFAAAFFVVACAQFHVQARAQDAGQGHLDRLNGFAGNKLVLLGEWKDKEVAEWRGMLAGEDLSEYGFALLGRTAHPLWAPAGVLDDFDAWLRVRCGSLGARWAALDAANGVIAQGGDAPSAKTLASSVEAHGIKSVLKQLRAFLKLNPGHLDARADLLKEVRRRAMSALSALPAEPNEDMEKGDDLRTWGVLARELDLAMDTDWPGYALGFFRPESESAEARSPLMRAAFRKNIGHIEDAIREYPTNADLWDTWAWMARALEGPGGRPALGAAIRAHDVFRFIEGLDPFAPPGGPTCPSPKVAAWLTKLAQSKGDWETAAKMAKLCRGFDKYILEQRLSWSPGLISMNMVSMGIEGYPEESSYHPHLDALLKLGMADEANDVFDEMLRISHNRAGAAAGAAGVARANGFEDLALAWSKGEPSKTVPYRSPYRWGEVCVECLAEGYDAPDRMRISEGVRAAGLRLPVYVANDRGKKTLGWSGDAFRWALLGGDGLVLEQGAGFPTPQEWRDIFKEKGIGAPKELAEGFLKKNPHSMGALLALAISGVHDGAAAMGARQDGDLDDLDLDSGGDDAIWGVAASAWAKVFNGDGRALFALPEGFYAKSVNPRSPTMRLASKRHLPKIEAALHRSPGSAPLWNLWLFWRGAGDNERDFGQFLESIEPSPMEPVGACPPPMVFDAFYNECRKNGSWAQLAKLLKEPFDRGISAQLAENAAAEKENRKPSLVYAELGDTVGYPLTEALLKMGRRQEADDVFKSWLGCGGRFTNAAELAGMARALVGDRTAKEWEAMAARGQR
jgi:tetratricopeptide (TPR) repeat protein